MIQPSGKNTAAGAGASPPGSRSGTLPSAGMKAALSAGSGRPFPSVSVVVPAKDADAVVKHALDAILAQDYPGSVEVVVADGSDPPALAGLLRETHPDVRVVANPGRIAASGLNAALRVATGEVVARCDAHAVLPPGYVSRAVETLEETGAANVGGMMSPFGGTLFGRAVALAVTSLLGSGGSRHRYGGAAGPADTVYLGVFRRRTLDEAGGFNVATPVNEDYELNCRLRERGRTVWFDPRLRVGYRTRGTWPALARQYLGYGWSKRLTIRRHPSSVRPRQVAAALPALGLAGSAVLALAGAPVAAWAWGPLGYAAALVVHAVATGVRRREPAALYLPLALATMHVAWGVGLVVPTAFFLSKDVRTRLERQALSAPSDLEPTQPMITGTSR